MQQYMVSVTITDIPEDIRDNVVQSEMKKVRELKNEGILENVYVSQRTKPAWMIFNCENQTQLEGILQSLPIYPYLVIDQIEILMPSIIMNQPSA